MEKVILLSSKLVERDADGNRVSLPPVEVGFFYGLCAPSSSASESVGRVSVAEEFDVYTRDSFLAVHVGDVLEIRGKRFTVSRPAVRWSRDGEHTVGIVVHCERAYDVGGGRTREG
ncbi:hypothetical protein [Alloscardovia macacae]|uniref:Phage head-tail adapter protein n=1 Tax=Alloscardovia macacae TaxID=1160091 RepID=A0A261F4P6_9BIFI|nr:hypothetical protein [Alloscardovia macacae]OZG54119.1 hypothetical protein ALMA_0580 [Alloscardovia macacae]